MTTSTTLTALAGRAGASTGLHNDRALLDRLTTAFSAAERQALARDGLLTAVGCAHRPVLLPETPLLRADALPLLGDGLLWSGRTAAWLWSGGACPRLLDAVQLAGCPIGCLPQHAVDRNGRVALPSGHLLRVRHNPVPQAQTARIGTQQVTSPARTAQDLALRWRGSEDSQALFALARDHADAVHEALQRTQVLSRVANCRRAVQLLAQTLAVVGAQPLTR
ncbi:hypothetical protein [Pseudoclavibacter soli]|uniref:hypothetical protein n=1 Tax=Pseudoclavibacter soli TaxID=452623 RepID=UPI000417BC08|nr:hypothetical protein [Pseudoclavibacter soli]